MAGAVPGAAGGPCCPGGCCAAAQRVCVGTGGWCDLAVCKAFSVTAIAHYCILLLGDHMVCRLFWAMLPTPKTIVWNAAAMLPITVCGHTCSGLSYRVSY